MPENPNPQGKGLVPVLQGIQQHWARVQVPPKQIDQISLELFTSMFVLQSTFKFNPVPEQEYFMYQREDEYRLLMVGPQEWSAQLPGRYIGRCVLQGDRTWTLELDSEVAADDAFMEMIAQRQASFQQALEQADSLEELMPTFEESLGFYGRAMAFILGKSLRASMELSGINTLSYEQAKGLLAAPEQPADDTAADSENAQS